MEKCFYLSCVCSDPRHMITFKREIFEDEDPELLVGLQMSPNLTFWQRVVLAFRYVFRSEKGYHYPWDVTLVSLPDTRKLIGFLEDHVDSFPKETCAEDSPEPEVLEIPEEEIEIEILPEPVAVVPEPEVALELVVSGSEEPPGRAPENTVSMHWRDVSWPSGEWSMHVFPTQFAAVYAAKEVLSQQSEKGNRCAVSVRNAEGKEIWSSEPDGNDND